MDEAIGEGVRELEEASDWVEVIEPSSLPRGDDGRDGGMGSEASSSGSPIASSSPSSSRANEGTSSSGAGFLAERVDIEPPSAPATGLLAR